MGEKKVAIMVLKVNLQCEKCYRKVKKVLCQFPQIQDQVYDEKENTVTIKVVCCSPEKIKEKICCKGGDSVKSIEIVPPSKPKEPEKPKVEKPKEKSPPPPSPKPDPAPAPAPAPTPAPAPKPAPCLPPRTCCRECYEGRGGGPCHQLGPPRTCCRECYEGHGGGPCYKLGNYGLPEPAPSFPPRTCCEECYEGRGGGPCYQIGLPRTCCRECQEGRGGGPCRSPDPAPGFPPRTCCKECQEGRGGGPCRSPNPAPGFPRRTCCRECYEGRGGGPCYQLGNYGLPSFYDGHCGRPVSDSWGGGGGCYRDNRCDYFSEENPSAACTIM